MGPGLGSPNLVSSPHGWMEAGGRAGSCRQDWSLGNLHGCTLYRVRGGGVGRGYLAAGAHRRSAWRGMHVLCSFIFLLFDGGLCIGRRGIFVFGRVSGVSECLRTYKTSSVECRVPPVLGLDFPAAKRGKVQVLVQYARHPGVLGGFLPLLHPA